MCFLDPCSPLLTARARFRSILKQDLTPAVAAAVDREEERHAREVVAPRMALYERDWRDMEACLLAATGAGAGATSAPRAIAPGAGHPGQAAGTPEGAAATARATAGVAAAEEEGLAAGLAHAATPAAVQGLSEDGLAMSSGVGGGAVRGPGRVSSVSTSVRQQGGRTAQTGGQGPPQLLLQPAQRPEGDGALARSRL